jgi:hypothetical protein
MCFQGFIKFGLVFLILSLTPISLVALSQTEVNATYIYLPKIPNVDATTPIAKKALTVPPVITVTPKVESKTKTISQEEYLEYQKLKSKIKKN